MASMEPVALEIQDLSFSYACEQGICETPALAGVNLSVESGSFVLLTGATGGGKTTFLRCCKPELTPTGQLSGRITVFGTDITELSALDCATHIGYVAQNPETQMVCSEVWHELVFGMENVGLDQAVMRRRAAEIAHFFGIEPWFKQQTAQLSGGQKQLLAVAGALALRPRLLLLDEPTSQLDPVAEKDFLHMLFRVNRELGVTVVVATHAPEAMAPYATRCVRLEQGGAVKEVSLSRFEYTQTFDFMRRTAARAAAGPKVELRDVYVRYDRSSPFVLHGADLQVCPSTIHALVGGNGCGKSTLLKTIAGNLKVQRGVCKNGLQRAQAYLPQNPKALFVCDTVLEEAAEWLPGKDTGVARETLAQVGLADAADRHPYDLSGGQQQMLALAKVLAPHPQLLLLDEPTKGLDTEWKLQVARTLLEQAAAGVTVVLATHDLSFAACVADQVSLLFDGQVACSQPADGFFAENLFYKPQPDQFMVRFTQEASHD